MVDFIERVRQGLQRVDGWVSLVTGMGAPERSKQLQYAADAILPPELLEQLFVGDPYAKRICCVVPEEAMRQGFRVVTGDAAEESAILAHHDARGAGAALQKAWTWGRVFGGGAVFVGADDGRDPRDPLDEANIRSVRFLTVLDRRELQVVERYRDPLAGNYDEPERYLLTRQGAGGAGVVAQVHESRLIRFRGGVTSRRRAAILQGWGESELQRVYDTLAKFNGAWESTATVLYQASVGVFSMKNLFAMMAADKRDVLKNRLEVMDLAMSSTRSVLVDADGESFTRTEVGALSGLAQVLDKFLLLLSGAAEIPVTILMGQSPAGLSATGESDVRWFYDRVKSAQTNVLLPHHLRLFRLLCLAHDGPTGGRVPEKLTVEYKPLWQMTPAEEADLRQKQATTDALYIDKGVVTAEEVAASRFRATGWSAETTVDFDDRADVDQAAEDAAALTKGQGTPEAPGSDHAEGAAGIIAKVAARELPRDAGIALLVSSMGMDPAAAEAAMGEAGKSFFTAPEATHAAEMDALRSEHAKLQASARGTQQMLTRVLERNRAGELVVGNVISKPATELAEGEALAEGDVVEVPVEDSARSIRTDGGGDGVAVVLALPPAVAAALPASPDLAPDLHVTLCYLGRLSTLRPGGVDAIVAAVRQWALTVGPIEATLGGIGRFAAGPDGDPVYVPVDSEAITDARPALVAFLRAAGSGVARGHGFTPHVTLAYVGPGDATRPPVAPTPVVFPRVSVWAGEQRVDVELTGGA